MTTGAPNTPPPGNHNQITSFDQFWLHYLREHSKPVTRALHFAGLLLAMAGGAAIWLWELSLYLLLGLPLVVYVCAFSGHYLAEHNHPTTYRHPLWSVISFFRMFRYWITGRLTGELRRAGIRP